jgi:Flp pilus assembly CpaF family ATPase
MMKLMESQAGSLSTIHAKNAQTTLRRLAGLMMENPACPQSERAVETKIATALDIVVHLNMEIVREKGRERRKRYVAEIARVELNDERTQAVSVPIFQATASRIQVPIYPPEARMKAELLAGGWDEGRFLAELAGR